jgi:hypothetical protein
MNKEIQTAPFTKEYYEKLKAETRQQMEQMIQRAITAHKTRPKVHGRFRNKYNHFVGENLAKLPEEAVKGMHKGVDSAMKEMVKAVLPDDCVRPEQRGDLNRARNEIAKQMSTWLQKQEFMEEAFYFAQNVVTKIAAWLQEKLTIRGEIQRTRDWIEEGGETTPQQVQEGEKKIKQLAQRDRELDERVDRQLKEHRWKFKFKFDFKPKPVLDVAKYFLDRVDVGAGITLKRDDVTLKFGTKVTLKDPFLPGQPLADREPLRQRAARLQREPRRRVQAPVRAPGPELAGHGHPEHQVLRTARRSRSNAP